MKSSISLHWKNYNRSVLQKRNNYAARQLKWQCWKQKFTYRQVIYSDKIRTLRVILNQTANTNTFLVPSVILRKEHLNDGSRQWLQNIILRCLRLHVPSMIRKSTLTNSHGSLIPYNIQEHVQRYYNIQYFIAIYYYYCCCYCYTREL